ncbi:UDP-3-O-acyl-N-acetylglucosamine deacetylase [Rubrimonas cliftonensis]|uniref:UDP-3-O-acyl-N-acetylglucosamine deacetylase n=1 Tax=Rubrimonas cliftonensis TaxID=89524 RepID=A0A1H3VW03_9RHOB|nr:UDP-3-O-acyl-N-acetylglucosamine deacetylase [Rubrimonas cliftonensis]SDZ78871.1 UDP-3-O-[3-hydroxymyristoyl] N-acetylglucosamine deacetylase [Rubrimonas cliftonensis]
MQATVARSLVFTGVGLHGGAPVRMVVRPAAPGEGVRFHRVDVADRDPLVHARFDAVVDARLCTMIGNADGVTVSTVEHVMAALAGMGVDNALITIDGPEAPILDGSAQPFVDAIAAVGLAYQAAPRRALRVLRAVRVENGAASAALSPAAAPTVAFDIDFADAAIGRQTCAFAVTPEIFSHELADCRTFVRRTDIDALRAAGLALGGGLHNAVVVDGAAVLNPEGLRRPDEFVRHKALDAVGDLALAGGPILGAYHGVRAGHAMTNALLRALFADRSAWRWEPAPPRADAGGAVAAERMAAE